jgi:hypothetical protein
MTMKLITETPVFDSLIAAKFRDAVNLVFQRFDDGEITIEEVTTEIATLAVTTHEMVR